MRWLLKVTTAMALIALTANLAGACDGCPKGGKELPGSPTPAGQVMPPNSFAAPQTMPMPPTSPMTTLPMAPAIGIPDRQGGCPCGVGERGRAGIPPVDRRAAGSCTGCPSTLAATYSAPTGRNAVLEANRFWSNAHGCNLYVDPASRVTYFWSETPRGYFPLTPYAAIATSEGPPASTMPPQGGYSTQYYMPNGPVQIGRGDGRLR